MSQEAGNKPVLLAMALKDKTMEGIQALREVIRSCQVWWSCTIWIQGNDLESMTHHHFFERTRNENDGMSLCWFWTRLGMWWIFLYCVEWLWVFFLWQVCGPDSWWWDENSCLNRQEKCCIFTWGGVYIWETSQLCVCARGVMDAKLCSYTAPQRGTPSAEWVKETLMNLILHGWLVFFSLCKNHFNWNTSLRNK